MNSSLLLMLALMGGGGLGQPLIQAMMDAQKDTFERWKNLLMALGNIITTGIFFLRGMPAPVDATGNPIFTNEALSKQIQASFTEGKREAFWVALVNGVISALLEFMRPSAAQQALFTSLLNRPASSTTVIGTTPAFGTIGAAPITTSITATRPAGQVLRSAPPSFVRAQAVYFNPATGEMAIE
jgi:hypothetical protein